MLLSTLFAACEKPATDRPDPGETGVTRPDTGETGTAPEWVSLPATCEPPAELPEDPLTLEGQARVTQEGGASSGFLEALDLEIVGDRVWAVGQGGLVGFDVADPAAPRRVYGPWEPSRGKLHRVEPVQDGWLATSQRDEGIYLWDVRDPENAAIVGAIEGVGYEGLAHVDGRLWASQRDAGIAAFDVSDPTAPVEIARADGLEAPWEIASTGDGWLYAADGTLGVVPIDIRDPLAPVVGTAFAFDGPVFHVRYADDRLWVARGGDGVTALDVSERDAPAELHTVTTGGSAVATDVGAGRLWVADHASVSVFDLSASPPTPIQSERTEQFAMTVRAAGDRAFVGDWNLLDVYALDTTVEAPALTVPSDTVRYAEGQAELEITNRGAAPLLLAGATSDAAIAASSAEIAPGETAILRLSDIVGDTALCLASDDPDGPTLTLPVQGAAAPPAGVPAPDFTLTDLDGGTHRLSEELGHPVLLAYFATW